MIVKEIKTFLFNKKQASLDEILFHLNWDKEVVLHVLNFLIQRDLIKKELLRPLCKRCYGRCNCNNKDRMIIYKIIE
jgi:hypothetical protein